MSLNKKLDGDVLDLSLMNLKDVPVSEIAKLKRGIKLDLSNNILVHLSSNFATKLVRLTKIDLSSNRLVDLPQNFGELVNLNHLDLYKNQLRELPLSIATLSELRYLDVKNNPLYPALARAAGECQDNRECVRAAKSVKFYLGKLLSEQERDFSFRVLQQKETDMAKEREENAVKAKEKERKKAEKRAQFLEKERLRIRSEESGPTLNEKPVVRPPPAQNGKTTKNEASKKNENSQSRKSPKYTQKKSNWSCLGLLNVFLLIGVLIAAGFCAFLYTGGNLSVEGVHRAWPRLKTNSKMLWNITSDALKYENLKSTFDSVQTVFAPVCSKLCAIFCLWSTAVKKLSLNAFLALQNFTGDLQPYLERIKPMWDTCVAYVTSLMSITYEWIASVDWVLVRRSIRKFVASVHIFVTYHVQNLWEGLWKIDAVTSLWANSEPYRISAYKQTVFLFDKGLESGVWICETIFPILETWCVEILLLVRNSLENVVSYIL